MPTEKKSKAAGGDNTKGPERVSLALPIEVAIVIYDILCQYEGEDSKQGDDWRTLCISAGGAEAHALHYLLEELAGRLPSPSAVPWLSSHDRDEIVAAAKRRLLTDE